MEPLETLSIRELKAFINTRGMDYSGCIEKSELFERAREAQHLSAPTEGTAHSTSAEIGAAEWDRRYVLSGGIYSSMPASLRTAIL